MTNGWKDWMMEKILRRDIYDDVVGQVRKLLLERIINYCVNHFLKRTSISAICIKLRDNHA